MEIENICDHRGRLALHLHAWRKKHAESGYSSYSGLSPVPVKNEGDGGNSSGPVSYMQLLKGMKTILTRWTRQAPAPGRAYSFQTRVKEENTGKDKGGVTLAILSKIELIK